MKYEKFDWMGRNYVCIFVTRKKNICLCPSLIFSSKNVKAFFVMRLKSGCDVDLRQKKKWLTIYENDVRGRRKKNTKEMTDRFFKNDVLTKVNKWLTKV